MFNKILFLGRHNDYYSNEIIKILKKKSKKVLINLVKDSKNLKKKDLKKYNKYNYDYIFSYRTYYILEKELINKAKFAAINFHTATPKYRGIGCTNFAILNGEKIFGCTAHLISEKIDGGSILNVKRFKVKKKNNLTSILNKLHKVQFLQIKSIINSLFKNRENLKFLKQKSKNEKWSKKLYTRKDLNNLYIIDPKVNNRKLEKIIKSTLTANYKPYLLMYGKKFILV